MRHHNSVYLPGPGDWWTPPDDPPWIECPECEADPQVMPDCECCAGHGKLDAESGQPYDQREFARMAEDRT